jgi:hypothetical protein
MKDIEVAELFAAQTAITHLIVEELSNSGVIDRRVFTNKLYDLLYKQASLYDDKPSSRSAPIRHLIHLLEEET